MPETYGAKATIPLGGGAGTTRRPPALRTHPTGRRMSDGVGMSQMARSSDSRRVMLRGHVMDAEGMRERRARVCAAVAPVADKVVEASGEMGWVAAYMAREGGFRC